jgi:hypothetical protein
MLLPLAVSRLACQPSACITPAWTTNAVLPFARASVAASSYDDHQHKANGASRFGPVILD